MSESLNVKGGAAVACSALLAGGDTICACCGSRSERQRSIHRDGFGKGPEVWLCNDCGMGELPTLAEIWSRIKSRMAKGCRIDYVRAS